MYNCVHHVSLQVLFLHAWNIPSTFSVRKLLNDAESLIFESGLAQEWPDQLVGGGSTDWPLSMVLEMVPLRHNTFPVSQEFQPRRETCSGKKDLGF